MPAPSAPLTGLTARQYETVLKSFEVMARVQTRDNGRHKFIDDPLDAHRRLG